MSIFQDSNDAYSADWYSSPWKPYHNKLTSRTLGEDSGDDTTIKVWCAEEELEGKVFTLTCASALGSDVLTSVSYPNPEGGTCAESDDFNTDEVTAHDDRSVKWWYGPGVAMQFPDGIHATNGYTQNTVYTHTIAASDIGERVYDGGIHCWMKLPHAPQGAGIPAVTDFYSKNIPMEYINSEDFLMVFNSYGHLPRKVSGTNVGLTVQFQYADVLDAETGQFVNDILPVIDDMDPTSFTDVSASHMAVAVVTGSGNHRRANAKSIRFYWFTEDTAGTEAVFHGGQFIRVSLYPING
jgi:hypothetical protein